MTSPSPLNTQVRAFWEQGPCGTAPLVTGSLEKLSPEWFRAVEDNRYAKEPFIHGHAQFTRHRGARILEIGVGAGSDHLQWALAGAECHGIDLTDAGIETTRAHLALHGLSSDLRRHDAESLPFPENHFDIVWSWGVIHHSENPARIIAEIRRVLKPGGEFRGMMYKRWSLAVFADWVKYALLKGRPWRTFADVLWHHFESVGTKAYELRELRELFPGFQKLDMHVEITPYDLQHWPRWLALWFPRHWGSFILIRARK